MVNIPILNLTHHHHKDVASLRNVSESSNYEEHSYQQSLKQSTWYWVSRSEVFFAGKFIAFIETKCFETEPKYLYLLLL